MNKERNTKVAIIGYGHVGQAYHKVFPDAVIHDLKDDNHQQVNECGLAIICVPTPTAEDGEGCDLSVVESVMSWLETGMVLIKSTVAPGTTAKLQEMYPEQMLVFSPEYIGEGGYFVQYWKYPHPDNPLFHDFMVLGGDKKATSGIIDIFIRKMGPHVRFMQTDSRTAEVIKYMENMYFATKVTFVNEMFEVCQAVGVDYNEVREGWLMDPRVDRNHTAVFPDKRGFEGKCLVKDSKALIAESKAAGYFPGFLQAVIDNNNRIRKENGCDEQ